MAFSIKIQGREFRNFQDFKLGLKFNSVASTFSFTVIMDPNNPDHRRLFQPFSYRKLEVFADKELVLTGVILNHEFVDNKDKNPVSVSGYSVTGVLEDSSIPVSLYPLQSDEKSIAEITRRLIEPFGLSLTVNASEADETVDVSTADVKDSIKSYISDICAQKNLVLSHTATGRLIITKVSGTRPRAELKGYTEASLSADGQSMHDTITVVKQAGLEDENVAESAIRNPFIIEFATGISPRNPFVPNFRPLVKEQTSNQENDTDIAAQNILANELRNLEFEIDLPNWYVRGELIMPGQVYQIESEDLFFQGRTNIFVESVDFSGTPDKQVSKIKAVLPEVYTGGTPRNIFT